MNIRKNFPVWGTSFPTIHPIGVGCAPHQDWDAVDEVHPEDVAGGRSWPEDGRGSKSFLHGDSRKTHASHRVEFQFLSS